MHLNEMYDSLKITSNRENYLIDRLIWLEAAMEGQVAKDKYGVEDNNLDTHELAREILTKELQLSVVTAKKAWIKATIRKRITMKYVNGLIEDAQVNVLIEDEDEDNEIPDDAFVGVAVH